MFQDLLLLLGLAYITYCGALCARHTLRLTGFLPAAAAGLPLGMGLFTLTVIILRSLFSLPISAGLALILLRLCDFPNDWRRHSKQDEELPPPLEQPESFGRFTAVMLSGAVIVLLAVLHGLQLSSLPADFASSYPFTRAFLKGPLSFNAPFCPTYPYTGGLYQTAVCASLSLTLNGDVLRTAWLLQSIFLIDAVYLWALALRLFLSRALPAALSSVLLFYALAAAAVKAGCAADCSSLMGMSAAGALFLLFCNIIRYCKNHWKVSPWSALLLGSLTFWAWGLSPAAAAVVCAAFTAITAAYSFKRRSLAPVIWRSFAMISAAALLWGLTQVPLWQQLWLCHLQGLILPQFPSRHFMAAASAAAGQTQYFSLLSLAALKQHSLYLWLGLPLIIWVIRRKSSKGLFLCIGGILLYFVPGAVGFQTKGMAPPWMWRAASDGIFAVLTGFALGDIYQLWARSRSAAAAKWQRTVLALLAMAMISPLFCDIAIVWQQRSQPSCLLKYICNPLYPSTQQWLADVPQLQLTPQEREAANWLWNNSSKSYRAFFDIPDLEAASPARLALLAGQAGCLPVGSAHSITSDQPDSDYLQPAPGVLAFLHSQNPAYLLSLGTELIVSWRELPLCSSEHCKMQPWPDAHPESSPELAWKAYTIQGTLPWDRQIVPCPTPSISIELQDWPTSQQIAGGAVYLVNASFNRKLHGWLLPAWYDGQKRWISQYTALGIYLDGDKQQIPIVIPFKEGKYHLGWLFYPSESPDSNPRYPLQMWRLAGSTAIEHHLSATLENSLRLIKVQCASPAHGVVTITNISPRDLNIGSDLHLRWKIWSAETHNYIYYNKAEFTKLPLPLPAGSTIQLPWRTAHEMRPNEFLEFNVSVPFGFQYSLTRK